MPMAPEEMAATQEQAGGDGGGEITKLVQQVGDGLAKLSEVLSGSQAATDQDREKMAGIMNSYIDLVENGLGGAGPGEDPEPEQVPEQGVVPATGGAKGVPMGPQTRM